jgi:SPP1 family predicted phage head-tail adaptor
MTIGAGKYNRRIKVQRIKSTATVNAAGQINETTESNWETFHDCWARIEYRAGRESLTGDQVTANDAATVFVRSCERARAITTDMRFTMQGRVFSISQPPVDVGEKRVEVRFPAVEVRV